MTIDIEELRESLIDESFASYVGGNFGGALMEADDIENATADELVEMAIDYDIDLSRFAI